jgi:hypothetical protein
MIKTHTQTNEIKSEEILIKRLAGNIKLFTTVGRTSVLYDQPAACP